MCQMIVNPAGPVALSKAALERLLLANPHGVGLAYCAQEQITVIKHQSISAEALLFLMSQVPPASPTLLHFRQSTCGTVSERNVQPFFVTTANDCILAHNGTIAGWATEFNSDSFSLSEELRKATHASAIDSLALEVKEIWQPGNRFALLNN